MNPAISAAFEAGSGVNPGAMKLLVATIATAVVLAVALWVILQLTDAMRNEQLETGEALFGLVKLVVLVLLLLYVILIM